MAVSARLIGAAVVILTGQASAHTAAPPDATPVAGVTVTAHRTTGVDGVTVTARRCVPAASTVDPSSKPPAIVSTYPREGEVAPPGYLALKVVFDQPMSDCSFSYGPKFPFKFPAISGRPPTQLPGGRAFVLLVQVQPGAQYVVKLNAPDRGYFISRAGLAAPPVELSFSTSDAPPLSADQALARASG